MKYMTNARQMSLPSMAIHGILSSMLIVLGLQPLSATVRTVSNFANHPAQYTAVQAAINASLAGDTIYITGSPNAYATFDITKQLTIIGAGFNNGGPSSRVGEVYYRANSSNTVLIGVHANNVFLNTDGSGTLSGMRFERCRATSIGYNTVNSANTPVNNVTVRNCVVEQLIRLPNNSNNILITNNLIIGMTGASLVFNNTGSTNVLVSHNLFVSTSQQPAFSNLTNAVVSDNIFWGRTPVTGTVTNTVFNNNITYQTTNDVIPYAPNTGSNNLVGVDPQFVNAPNRSGSLTYDYNVVANSPADTGSSDGTEIGFFGGPNAFVDLSGRSRIPLVTAFQILNPTISQGGSLNVEFSGTTVE